jgi:hypothetical protein
MHYITKYTICLILMVSATAGLLAQTNNTKGAKSTNPKTAAKPKAAVPVSHKEITVAIKNMAEKEVSVFAGPKEELAHPRPKVLGGLSKNTLYIHENDVVCVLNNAGKPTACTNIKPGATYVEINNSGTGVISK